MGYSMIRIVPIPTPRGRRSAGQRSIRSNHLPWLDRVRALLVLLLIGPPMAHPAAEIPFRRIGGDDGLSSSLVLCMVQDRRGFLWIGTEDGLNRHDGREFVTYRHDPRDSTTLSCSYIWSLCEDRHGLLWIGTWGGGLNRYDPVRRTFTRFPRSVAAGDTPGHDRITAILEDQKDGALWICSAGGGLDRFDPATGRFEDMDSLLSGLPPAPRRDLFCLTQTKDGALWVGTYYAGLLRIDRQRREVREYRHDPADRRTLSDDRVLSLCETDDGKVWVGTWEGGLNRIDPVSGVCERFRHRERDPHSLPGDIVRSIRRDRAGRLWLGTIGGGGAVLDESSLAFHAFRHSPFVRSSVSDDVITCILQDAGGTLWFGTANGLSVHAPSAHKFSGYTATPGVPGTLQGKRVFALCADSAGLLWAGTEDGGLNRLDHVTGRFRSYAHDPGDPFSLPHNHVSALLTDTHGDLWVGTYGGGLARLLPDGRGFERYQRDRAAPSRELNGYISALLEDRQGHLWVGTWVAGLMVMDRRGTVLRRFFHDPGDPGSIPDNEIRALALDHAGNVLVGTVRGGMCRFAMPAMERMTGPGVDLPAEHIQAIMQDRAGRLWAGSFGSGLFWSAPPDTEWHRFTTHEGLPSDVVYGILEDGQGRLWVSTHRGLCVIASDRSGCRTFTRHDGLMADEFNFNALTRGPGGVLYFGGVNGFNAVNPDSIVENTHVAPVVVTGIRMFDRDHDPGVAPFAAGSIVLDHDANFLSIEYALLDFALPHRNTFAYRLEGVDRDWVRAGTRRVARYTNLDPGHYEFRVIGANNDGVWNREGATLGILIRPPFWQTVWFRGLVGLVLAGVIAAAVRNRSAARRRLEHLRLRIASDLHDEIGSSLASIAVLADLVRERTVLPDREMTHLRDISRAARGTSSALRDIVWFINPEHDRGVSIIERLRSITTTLLAGIPHTVQVVDQAGSGRFPMDFRRDLVLIYKEILSNVVRHAGARHVDVHLRFQHGVFSIAVTDDGCGFDCEAGTRGNGLASMRRRADALGARLVLRSAPGEGTVTVLEGEIP